LLEAAAKSDRFVRGASGGEELFLETKELVD
jgi:hypothetical protein